MSDQEVEAGTAVEIYDHDDSLVQRGGVFALEDPAAMIEKAAAAANVLKDVVAKAGLVANIGGKEYLTVDAWTTLGVLVGCTARTEWSREIEGGFEAAVEVVNAHGLVIGRAEAVCTRSERNWKNRDDYALKSMAQTRAMGKALRMPLGWIAVLAGYQATPADEMPSEGSQEPAGRAAPIQGTLRDEVARADVGRPPVAAKSWAEWTSLMRELGVEDPAAIVEPYVLGFFAVTASSELSAAGKKDALQRANTAYLTLAAAELSGAESALGIIEPERLAAAFSVAFDGLLIA